jgi:hypothetical protein
LDFLATRKMPMTAMQRNDIVQSLVRPSLRRRLAMKPVLAVLLASSSVAGLLSVASAQHAMMSDTELMAKLKDAAPANVIEHATVMNMGADGKMKVIQQGNNGWTCMDPGGAPMCADQAAMEWVQAWQSKGPGPQKLGFIYMLNGDNGASNTDPYATKETPDNNWIKTGSHVMIVGAEAKNMAQAYPRDAKPDPTKPYVMWPGSPYEHLMLPVK